MDDSRIRKAADLVGALLSPEIADKVGMWSGFFTSWQRAAGDRLAAHSKPVDLRNGIAIVEAEHPGWIQLLQMEQDRILSSIQTSFPELAIKGIAFRLASEGGRGSSGHAETGVQKAVPGKAISAAAAAEEETRPRGTESVEQTLAAVKDDGFREILSSLADTVGS